MTNNKKFRFKSIEVNSNSIEVEITNDNGQDIEMNFWQVPLDKVQGTLGLYGLSLSENYTQEYDCFEE